MSKHPAYLTESEYPTYTKNDPSIVALYSPQTAECGHCSTGRIYYIRKGNLSQITIQCVQCQNFFKYTPVAAPSSGDDT